MEKYRKYSILFSVIGLILILTGVTYSFFNYTRVGIANNFRVGNISFNTSQDGNINLTNVFPIKSSDLSTDIGNHDSVTISITGSTDYSNGLEYLVTVEEVNNVINGKRLPMSFTAEVTGVGDTSADYYNERGGNSSIYNLYETGKIKNGSYLLAGFIKNGQTGINGSVTITAFIDADKIAVTDTPNENSDWINGRVVFSTAEWNNFQGNNSLSFKIKVEANEGIWVRDPFEETPSSCFTTSPAQPLYIYNTSRTVEDISNCETYLKSYLWSDNPDTGETVYDYCAGTGTSNGQTIQTDLLNNVFDKSKLLALANYNIITNTGNYITSITSYDETCSKNVVIPEYIDTVSKEYMINPNMTSEDISNCANFLGGGLEWSNGIISQGETLEGFCSGTGTHYGETMSDYLSNGGFGQYELDNLETTNVIISTSTTISAKVIEIGSSAFSYMNLQSVTFPDTITVIKSKAFKYNEIDEVILPNSYTGNICSPFVFDKDVSITQNGNTFTCGCFATAVSNGEVTITGYDETCPKDVVIPREINGNIVTKIGAAFSQKQITSVVIPDTVTRIGDDAFLSNNLTTVTIPNSVTELGYASFSSNKLTSVTLPETIDYIPSSCFSNNNLISINLPSTLRSINNDAFYNNNITNLVIPNSVTYIGRNAFSTNPIERLVLLNSVGTIYGEGSIPLSNATYIETNLEDNRKLILSANEMNTLIIGSNVKYIPVCRSQTCRFDTVNINSNLLVGPDYTLSYGSKSPFELLRINNLVLGDTITQVGTYTFYNNEISSVDFSNSVTSIGQSAFSHNQITSLSIPNSITSIGDYAFTNNALTDVTIGNGITTIDNSAFNKGATSNQHLSSITINLPCSTIMAMTNYPFLGASQYQSGTTIYGSNNEVCQVY